MNRVFVVEQSTLCISLVLLNRAPCV